MDSKDALEARLRDISERNRKIENELNQLDQARQRVNHAIRRIHGSIQSLEGLLVQARENKRPLDEQAVTALLDEGRAAADEARGLLGRVP